MFYNIEHYAMAICCDRCGKKLVKSKNGYVDKDYSARMWISPVGERNDISCSQRMDICEDCYEKFINWLESEV